MKQNNEPIRHNGCIPYPRLPARQNHDAQGHRPVSFFPLTRSVSSSSPLIAMGAANGQAAGPSPRSAPAANGRFHPGECCMLPALPLMESVILGFGSSPASQVDDWLWLDALLLD